jgi:hypothetical protein
MVQNYRTNHDHQPNPKELDIFMKKKMLCVRKNK